jgi:hypothetical protein
MNTPRILFILLLTVSLTGCGSAAASSMRSGPDTLHETGPFDATVDRGPDAGQAYADVLHLRISRPSGRVAGTLTRKGTTISTVAGNETGGAINLLFRLGPGRHLFGVGTAVYFRSNHRIELGGPFVGPRRGDSGGWAASSGTSSGAQNWCNATPKDCPTLDGE